MTTDRDPWPFFIKNDKEEKVKAIL